MKVAILDDEPVFVKKIEIILCNELSNVSITGFSTPKELLSAKEDFDLLLLDIEMPQMNGLLFAKTYANIFLNIIFVTSHDELVYDAFGKNILGFIRKNQLKEELIRKIKQFIDQQKAAVIVETSEGQVSFPIKRILYFRYDSSVISLKTNVHLIILNYRSLKQLQHLLDPSVFCFIDRNTIINVTQILHFIKARKEVEMYNHDILKVSKRKWRVLLWLYNEVSI